MSCDHCGLMYKLAGEHYGTESEIIENKFCPMCGAPLTEPKPLTLEECKEKTAADIEFYIPKSEKVPTRLRLKVDGLDVYYRRAQDEFAYEFEVFEIDTPERGEEIVQKLAGIMCNQSYDHGAEWRIANIDLIKGLEWNSAEWKVSFRIKDSY